MIFWRFFIHFLGKIFYNLGLASEKAVGVIIQPGGERFTIRHRDTGDSSLPVRVVVGNGRLTIRHRSGKWVFTRITSVLSAGAYPTSLLRCGS